MNIIVNNLEGFGEYEQVKRFGDLLRAEPERIFKEDLNYEERLSMYQVVNEYFGSGNVDIERIISFIWFDVNIYKEIAIHMGKITGNIFNRLDMDEVEEVKKIINE